MGQWGRKKESGGVSGEKELLCECEAGERMSKVRVKGKKEQRTGGRGYVCVVAGCKGELQMDSRKIREKKNEKR